MDFAHARRHMIDSQIRPNSVSRPDLIAALASTPREVFLPAKWRGQAYVERETVYAPTRSLIPPRDFGKLLAAVDPRPTDLALDVACGLGYTTAVLAQLVEMVVAIDDETELTKAAQAAWSELGIDNAAVVEGDPGGGAASQGPFDLILMPFAVEDIPPGLLDQLKDGGRLATLLRRNGLSKAVVALRSGGDITVTPQFDATAAFVAPAFQKPKVFAF